MSLKMFLGCGLILDQRCVAASRPGLAREGVEDIFFLQKESKPQQDQFRCRVTPGPGGRIAWVEGDYKEDRWVTLHGWMVLGG